MINSTLNDVTKIALMQYIYQLELDHKKQWFEYILMDAAYITLNATKYPYKGLLSNRFIAFLIKRCRGE